MTARVHHRRRALAATSLRRGVTLTEVLMALLVMGLGITSVFTLFPMSILRSVKSTNLTNATLLSQSVRDLYLANRTTLDIVPQQSTSPGVTIGITTYGKDPLLTATPVVPDTAIPSPFVGSFVIDPYGGISAPDYGATPGKFGEQTPGSTAAGARFGVLRVAGFLAGSTSALTVDNATSGDSWVTDYEEVPTNVTQFAGPPVVHDLTFSTTVDFNGLSTNQSRLLILSADGRRSVTRQLHGTTPLPANNQLRVSEALPDSMDAVDQLGLVRLQNKERRYTWTLTLNYPTATSVPTGQITVFFRRPFGDVEKLYSVSSFTNLGRTLRVSGYTDAVPKPGDHIFGTWIVDPGANPDEHHGRWYRIVVVADQGSGTYDITLDRTWVGLTRPTCNQPMLMFPQGVVGVYDLY